MFSTAITVVLACAGCSLPAQAQWKLDTAMTAMPSAALMCRGVAGTAADSADVLLRFIDAPMEKPRDLIVGFDSSGAPRYVAISVQIDDSALVQQLVARFDGKAVIKAEGREMRLDNTNTAVSPPLARVVLSVSEQTRLLALTDRLWAIPCVRVSR